MYFINQYWVYILASDTGTLYTGITNDLRRRIWEHKNGFNKGFTKKYNIEKLIYFEEFSDVELAIKRGKEIKGWRREKKENLIRLHNSAWTDLSKKLF